MEFVETPTFWYSHVDRAACTNFSLRTIELRPSESREILPFPFSLSFPFPFLSLRTVSFLFVFFPLFLLFFPFLFLFSHLIFSSFLFLFSFGIFSPISIIIDRMGQRRKLPLHCLAHTICVVHTFPSIFLIS